VRNMVRSVQHHDHKSLIHGKVRQYLVFADPGDSAVRIDRHIDALIAEGHLERVRLGRNAAGSS
jgi:hypothetical protein